MRRTAREEVSHTSRAVRLAGPVANASREPWAPCLETDERDAITEYVRGLKAGEGLDEAAIRAGYQRFKDQKNAAELAAAAQKHGLSPAALQTFVDTILGRMIFDGEQLTELLAPLDLGWRARTEKELALMADLVPLLKKRAGGRDIAGLKAYEE